ncbi:MAG: hypothetical protein ACAI38_22345 [Myxococcota bacterium]
MSTHDAISSFMLERYAVGELDGADLAAVEAALAADPALAARVESMRSARQQFLADEPYATFRIEHERRRAPVKKRFSLWLPTGFAAAAATALLLLFIVPEVDSERVKGSGVGLTVALVGSGAPKALASGAVVHPGDRLQLAYDAGDYRYLALIGIDGGGVMNVYYPEGGEVMARRPAESRGAFPFSLTLDATLGTETMVAVFAEQPLPLKRIEEAVRKNEVLPGVSTVRVTLDKE